MEFTLSWPKRGSCQYLWVNQTRGSSFTLTKLTRDGTCKAKCQCGLERCCCGGRRFLAQADLQWSQTIICVALSPSRAESCTLLSCVPGAGHVPGGPSSCLINIYTSDGLREAAGAIRCSRPRPPAEVICSTSPHLGAMSPAKPQGTTGSGVDATLGSAQCTWPHKTSVLKWLRTGILESRGAAFNSLLCHLLAAWPWESYLTSLFLFSQFKNVKNNIITNS